MDSFDLIVIGAGPGGYVCAFRAAQLGLQVALVERRPTLGGTCLNVGCIPSKALLQASEHYAWARHHAAAGGIKLAGIELDLAALMRKKDAVVQKLVGGVAQLAKARKITVLTGHAELTGAGRVKVGEQTEIGAKNIVLATGSAPSGLSFLPFDGRIVISSDDAVTFDAVPPRLVVVGGGAIGLELGSVWSRLGADVTIVEFLPKIAASYDDDVVRLLARLLAKQGLRIEVNARVTGMKPQGAGTKAQDGAGVVLTAERDGKSMEFPADKILVSVGRRPVTENLGLEQVRVELDERKRIRVDDHLRTNVPGIWAIGDVVAGPMLAHKAEEDGIAVAEWIAGRAGHIDWNLVPAIIYTDPEVAGVGLGEDGVRAKGLEVRTGKFFFAANGRALAADAADGFVKIIADAKTDRILGAQIIGRGASELIAEVVTHMEYGGSAEDLGRTIHAHPTLSEAVKEAGLAVSKSALHAL
jgi:dihydrolipoamide dehydrogenase